MAYKRNYQREYAIEPKSRRKERANRNLARRIMMRKGKVKKGDGKDVAHKNGNPKDNKRKNLTVKPKSVNRSFARTSKAKKINRRA